MSILKHDSMKYFGFLVLSEFFIFHHVFVTLKIGCACYFLKNTVVKLNIVLKKNITVI